MSASYRFAGGVSTEFLGSITGISNLPPTVFQMQIEAKVFQADLSDPAQVKALVAAAVNEFGRLDILANNAGRADFAPIGSVDAAEVHSQFALNVDGPIFATQAGVALFPQEGGRVISVSSVTATHAMPGSSVYSADKISSRGAYPRVGCGTGPQGRDGKRSGTWSSGHRNDAVCGAPSGRD
jgi:3-oxoacyl-[acyl-carrier protein] reductase